MGRNGMIPGDPVDLKEARVLRLILAKHTQELEEKRLIAVASRDETERSRIVADLISVRASSRRVREWMRRNHRQQRPPIQLLRELYEAVLQCGMGEILVTDASLIAEIETRLAEHAHTSEAADAVLKPLEP